MEILSNSTTYEGLKVMNTFAPGSHSNKAAILGVNTVDNGWGYGVTGKGGYVGVFGESTGNGTGLYTGVYGNSNGTNTGENVGVIGEASSSDYDYAGRFLTTGNGGIANVGVDALAWGAGSNYGGYLLATGPGGTNTGINVSASGASSTNTGIVADASGNTGTKYGVNASASGTGTNYAVKAIASGGTTNYAGYFEGKTYVSNYFGVGINPVYEIHVKQAGLSSASGIRTERNDNSNNWVTNIDGSDDYNFYYNGSLKGYIRDTDGVYVTNSDRRLKENIEPISSVLGNLLQLKPSKYHYIDAGSTTQSKTNGFIAQEVQSLFPEVVSEKNGYLGISYESMIPIAIKAIQEQQTIIDAQDARIAKLEALVQELIAKEN